jgi:hypothetical protein
VFLSDRKPFGFFLPKTNLPLPFPNLLERFAMGRGREKFSLLGFFKELI